MEPEHSIEGYSINRSIDGYITFRLNNVRIKKKDVPKHVVKKLEIYIKQLIENDHPPHIEHIYTTDELIHPVGYYYLEEYWNNAWQKFKEEYLKRHRHDNDNKHKRDDKEDKTIQNYIKLSPKELLDEYNIFSRKDWKLYMLRNHPDKNPEADTQVIALINMAINIVYPDIAF